jgi:hypothetical protein
MSKRIRICCQHLGVDHNSTIPQSVFYGIAQNDEKSFEFVSKPVYDESIALYVFTYNASVSSHLQIPRSLFAKADEYWRKGGTWKGLPVTIMPAYALLAYILLMKPPPAVELIGVETDFPSKELFYSGTEAVQERAKSLVLPPKPIEGSNAFRLMTWFGSKTPDPAFSDEHFETADKRNSCTELHIPYQYNASDGDELKDDNEIARAYWVTTLNNATTFAALRELVLPEAESCTAVALMFVKFGARLGGGITVGPGIGLDANFGCPYCGKGKEYYGGGYGGSGEPCPKCGKIHKDSSAMHHPASIQPAPPPRVKLFKD